MARARNIKPGLFTNELLVELPAFDRLMFIGLWCLADRDGRLEDRPKRIKLALFPYDTYDVSEGLGRLASAGFIDRYEVEGLAVIEIVNFLKHQKPHGSEKDGNLPDVNGYLTVNERKKNGVVTGVQRKVHVKEGQNNVKTDPNNVDLALDNGSSNEGPLLPNALILRFSDSPNPDSPNPEEEQKTLVSSGDETSDVEDDSGNAGEDPAGQDAGYSADFERFWSIYPRRHISSPKKPAWKAWNARLRAGVSASDLIRAAERYAKQQAREGKVGSAYIKLPATFLGPDEHWQELLAEGNPTGSQVNGQTYPFVPQRGYVLQPHEFWHPMMTDTVLSVHTHHPGTLKLRTAEGESC